PGALDGLLAAHHRLHWKRLREQKPPCGKPLRGGGRYAIQPTVSTDASRGSGRVSVTQYATRANRAPERACWHGLRIVSPDLTYAGLVGRPLRDRREAGSWKRRSSLPWPAGRPWARTGAGRRGR